MSTSETMMIDGARRLRTANFTDVDLASRHRRDFRRRGLGGRDGLDRDLRIGSPTGEPAVVAF